MWSPFFDVAWNQGAHTGAPLETPSSPLGTG